ncbi:hypothetical protein VPH35_087112 [Triticum aestivum]
MGAHWARRDRGRAYERAVDVGRRRMSPLCSSSATSFRRLLLSAAMADAVSGWCGRARRARRMRAGRAGRTGVVGLVRRVRCAGRAGHTGTVGRVGCARDVQGAKGRQACVAGGGGARCVSPES